MIIMKKTLLILLILLICLPVCCMAASQVLPAAVTPADVDTFDTLASVSIWANSKNAYLFLPSGWDASALKLWHTSGKDMTVNGTVTPSGSEVSCFVPGETVKVKIGNKSYNVKVMQDTGIPSVHITTASGKTTTLHKSKSNEETGRIRIIGADGELICAQDLTQIRCRGNSAFFRSPKKSYQIKLTEKQDLFGMGADKTWLLCSGFRDRSLIRNRLAMDMAQYAGVTYAPEMVFADAYVNGEYYGLFYLSEKVEIGEGRVEIDSLAKATKAVNDKPLSSYTNMGNLKKAVYGATKYYDIPNDPEDITGGYLLRREAMTGYKEHGSEYVTKRANLIEILEPKYATEKQAAYVGALMQAVENAIYADDGIDPDTGKHYSELIDVPSFVKVYTMEETLMYYNASIEDNEYFYKPADSVSTKLFAGPVWDYDACLGSYANHKKVTSITPTAIWNGKMNTQKTWYPALCKHEDFMAAVKEEWKTIFLPAMNILLGEEKDPDGVLLPIDEYTSQVSAAAAMDYIRWPALGGEDYSGVAGKRIGKTFESNITYLTNYVRERRDWLKEQWK